MKEEQMRTFNRIALLTLSIFVIATAAPVTVFAQDPGWQFTAELYLWGASVGGKTTSGSKVDVDFSDLVKDIKMGFMGLVGVQKGKWSLWTDAIYLDVKDDTTVASGQQLSAELTGWVVTPAVGYNLVDTERVRLDILGGARYLYLGLDLRLGPNRVEDSGSVWDGIVGVRGSLNLTEKWYLPYHLDVGTGDSDLTWQAFGGVGYRFNKFDVVLAYRYLSWNFDGSHELDDLNFHGPFAGIKFVF